MNDRPEYARLAISFALLRQLLRSCAHVFLYAPRTPSQLPCLARFSQAAFVLLRKEVIQPHLPIRLPCYDFTPITNPTFDGSLLAVKSPASGVVSFRGVTGGVYKARERIHRSMLTCDY